MHAATFASGWCPGRTQPLKRPLPGVPRAKARLTRARRPALWPAILPALRPTALALLMAFSVCALPALSQEAGPHGELGRPCGECHTVDGWLPLRQPLGFEHESTGFPLLGSHQQASCSECHSNPVFSHVAVACADCHADAHAGELGFDCESCHTPHTWENRRDYFDAHNRSLFPLFGTHATLDCSSCHEDQRPFEFATTPTECAGCHLDDYRTTANPNHLAAGFPIDCEVCHSPLSAGWQGAVAFEHPPSFRLTGGHLRADCEDCHSSGFVGTPTDCAACHLDDYKSTNDPNHAAAGFSTTCEECHGVESWETSAFDHARTAFPLTGAHIVLECDDCHSAGFANTPTDCAACHRGDYDDTRDPDHAAAGFPLECERCHSTSMWAGASFDHNQTGFTLTGRHRNLDCESCHADGYAGTPTDCVACHLADYNGTDDPNHQAAGFPTTCETCHSTQDWNADFDHDQTGFRLTGQHRSLECESCHADGYAGTPADCAACHLDDYQTADPNHAASGFGTDCQTCHNTSDWSDADFDHDASFFPIYSGKHREAWSSCADCHTNPSNYSVFTCLTCHGRGETRGHHGEVPGYVYESPACLACHPNGEKD